MNNMSNNTTKFLDESGLATFCNKLLTKIDNNYSSKKNIEWSNTGDELSNLNDFVNEGVYKISGERTRLDDNLPISNTGGGHTFEAKLTVYDSSLPNTGNDNDDCCITQVLTLSNRVGQDSNIYIRTAVGPTKFDLTWNSWSKLQTNTELGLIHISQLDSLVDNGMYSGVCQESDGTYETFVLITVNNHYIAGQLGQTVSCTQLKYGIDISCNIILKKRVGTRTHTVENDGIDTWEFNEWADVCEKVKPLTVYSGEPFIITADNELKIKLSNTIGTFSENGGLTINSATNTNLGGIKIAEKKTEGNNKYISYVYLNNNNTAYVETEIAQSNSQSIVNTDWGRLTAFEENTTYFITKDSGIAPYWNSRGAANYYELNTELLYNFGINNTLKEKSFKIILNDPMTLVFNTSFYDGGIDRDSYPFAQTTYWLGTATGSGKPTLCIGSGVNPDGYSLYELIFTNSGQMEVSGINGTRQMLPLYKITCQRYTNQV